jgi:transposase
MPSVGLRRRSPTYSWATQGAESNHKDSAVPPGHAGSAGWYVEPFDHAIGRSRGGLTSKVHQLVDGRGRPLVVLVGPGQAHDSPVLPDLLANLRVDRCGTGRPRTKPDAVVADKAYSSRAHRERLRARGIKAVIPERSDQIRNRKHRGARGGRPPAFDTETYRGRNVVERSFNTLKQWRGLATRYDKLAIVYRGAAVLRAITIWLKHL